MTNSAPNPRNTEVLGHLFGWPIRAHQLYNNLFANSQTAESITVALLQRPITDKQTSWREDTQYLGSSPTESSTWSTFSFEVQSFASMGGDKIDRITDYLCKCALRAKTIDDKEAYELASAIVIRAYKADSTQDIYSLSFAWKYGSSPELAAQKIEYTRSWMLHSSTNRVALPLPPKKKPTSITLIQEKRNA